MKKIRINELARELEVKAHEILDRLPELGVAEKKTHSSSIDEDVAIRLRRLLGFEVPDQEPAADEPVTQAHETAAEALKTRPEEAAPGTAAEQEAAQKDAPMPAAPTEMVRPTPAGPRPPAPHPAGPRPQAPAEARTGAVPGAPGRTLAG